MMTSVAWFGGLARSLNSCYVTRHLQRGRDGDTIRLIPLSDTRTALSREHLPISHLRDNTDE